MGMNINLSSKIPFFKYLPIKYPRLLFQEGGGIILLIRFEFIG